MKILILNYSDLLGGASIAANRLFTALKQFGIEIAFAVIDKNSNNKSIIKLHNKNKINLFNKICKKILKHFNKFSTGNPILHSVNNKTNIDINYINNSSFDLIHLHWVNNNMISIKDISKIKKPIVWTMHDPWVYCGAEHYPNILENDKRYIDGYTRKNKPKTTRGVDICRKTWNKKKVLWKNKSFHFISPSNYLMESFYKSSLFSNSKCDCKVIPNIVPQNIFKPASKNKLRECFQIPLNKKVIGFGAAYDVNNKKSIKGGYLLIDALKKIKEKSDYYLILFGNTNDSFLNDIDIDSFSSGVISNPNILSCIYNTLDVFVCPSLLENLPNVCLESLFCGIPVAAFNTGGIPDIVEHKKTGYLAECFNSDDLLNGVNFCIDNNAFLSENSLKKAQTDFNNDKIIKQHVELYESVLNAS